MEKSIQDIIEPSPSPPPPQLNLHLNTKLLHQPLDLLHPLATSRRASHDSAHDAHHFVNLDKEQREHEHKLNASLKKMWAGVKRHAVEHHRSVNAAYMASYGCGAHPGR
ncbi:hypothetical protein CFE70_001603 [Pyrenophora teres f. teres 0-1]